MSPVQLYVSLYLYIEGWYLYIYRKKKIQDKVKTKYTQGFEGINYS